MRFDLSKIQKLKPGAIVLRKPRDKRHYERTSDLMKAIKNFCRRMGIRKIPAATIDKLRTDPYFKYCFTPIIYYHYSLYTSDLKKEIRDRMQELLLRPDLANEADIYRGLSLYINNFTAKMPDGNYRASYEDDPESWADIKPLFDRIDQVLKAEGKMEKAIALKKASELEYLKFCLEIFERLVEEGYSPDELWR